MDLSREPKVRAKIFASLSSSTIFLQLVPAVTPRSRKELVMCTAKWISQTQCPLFAALAFVTFHRSYSYEDFVEGLRPETTAEDDGAQSTSGGFRLKPTDGVFKRIAALAEQAGAVRPAASAFDLEGRNFFKMSLGRAYDQSEIYQAAIDGGYVALGWGGDTDWSDPI
jgi:hypothetical protein